MTPAFEALLDQALQLDAEERAERTAHLLRSLEPDDGDVLIRSERDATWPAEIERRAREVREGRVQFADSDGVMAELRVIAQRP